VGRINSRGYSKASVWMSGNSFWKHTNRLV
jgi:hypothetical protein